MEIDAQQRCIKLKSQATTQTRVMQRQLPTARKKMAKMNEKNRKIFNDQNKKLWRRFGAMHIAKMFSNKRTTAILWSRNFAKGINVAAVFFLFGCCCHYILRTFILIYASHIKKIAFLLVCSFFLGCVQCCNAAVATLFVAVHKIENRSIVYDQPCDRESSCWSHTYSVEFIVLHRRQWSLFVI